MSASGELAEDEITVPIEGRARRVPTLVEIEITGPVPPTAHLGSALPGLAALLSAIVIVILAAWFSALAGPLH